MDKNKNRFNAEFFKLLTDNSFDIVSVVDAEGALLFESAATKRILGYENDERIGKNAFDFMHPDDVETIASIFRDLVEGGGGFRTSEFRYKHENGDWVWLEAKAQYFLDNPAINDVLVNSRDISARKNAEQKLKESESRFRSLFQSSPDAILLANRKTGFISFANQAAAELFEADVDYLIGKHQIELHPRIQHKKAAGSFQFEPKTEVEYAPPVEIEIVTAQNNRKTVEIRGKNIKMKGEEFILGNFRDITERKQAEQKLKESEEKYKRLINGLPDIVYIYNRNMGATYWSNQVKDVLGFEPLDLTKDPFLWTNAIHKDDRKRVIKILSEIREGDKFDIEYRIRDANGAMRRFRDRGFSIRNYSGEIVIEGVATDITERKRAEQDLKESESKFKALFEQSAVGLAVTDIEGAFVKVNRHLCDMLGYSEEELLSKTVIDITHPDDMEKEIQIGDKVIRGKQDEIVMEKRYKTKNGDYIWAYMHTNFIRDKNGNPDYIIGAAIDITERKEAELALKESEEKFSVIFNMSQSLICVADINAATFKFINPSFKKVLGFSEEDLLGKPFYEFIHPDDLESTNRVVEKELKAGVHVIHFENRYICKDNTYRWLDWNSYPIPEKGITYAIAHDVTERKKSVLALKKSEESLQKYNAELMEANAEKDKFISVLAHDLKSPFNGIMGMSEILVDEFVDMDEDELRQALTSIRDSSKNTLKLLNNLLDWARSRRGKTPFKPNIDNIGDLVREIVDLFKTSADNKKVKLDVDIPNDIEAEVDWDMVQSIVRNLLSNAIKYSRENGTVRIKLARNENCVEISIADEGAGIDENTLENLFNIGAAKSVIGTAGERGTGFGLLVCKEFAEKHGGSIEARSKLGEGSVFTARLPVAISED